MNSFQEVGHGTYSAQTGPNEVSEKKP